MLTWIKNQILIQRKLSSLLKMMLDAFDEINIGDKAVEIKLNKRVIIKNTEAISLNTDSVIILNGKLLHFNPTKISSISKEDLEAYNHVE
jgi:hypothetical protein